MTQPLPSAFPADAAAAEACAGPSVLMTSEAGSACVVDRDGLRALGAWVRAFSNCRKDRRYYEIVEDTIDQGFDYRYLVLRDSGGVVRAIQPCFLLDQDLLAGSGKVPRAIVGGVRKIFRKFMFARTLMVGCAAGEGHLDDVFKDPQRSGPLAELLFAAIRRFARQARARMIVLKEFPASYRQTLNCFASDGFTRVPSMPMVRLNIDYPDFETYTARAIGKSTRRDLRKKFERAEQAGAIEFEALQDVSGCIDEIYPLYLQVHGRATLQFETLTPEFFIRLGRDMPDKVRFFLWRKNGNAIAFSLALLEGQAIYDECLGMDYSVALDLHLYFWTLRDIIRWAMANGFKTYHSTALNYEPKMRLGCELAPLDLYVAHTSRLKNFFLRRILPWMEPTRGDPILKRFPNHADLWGAP